MNRTNPRHWVTIAVVGALYAVRKEAFSIKNDLFAGIRKFVATVFVMFFVLAFLLSTAIALEIISLARS